KGFDAGVGAMVDGAVDGSGVAVDHWVMIWVTESMVFLNLGSSRSMAWIFSTAWSTVVWSLPPKARPTSARDAWVSCRARYIAIWRGKAMAFVRPLARMSESLTAKNSAARRWMWSIVMIRSSSPHRSVRASWARSSVRSRWVSEQNAIIRVREPSISRMFALMREAMK